MAIFLVTSDLPDSSAPLRDLLQERFGEGHIFEVAHNQWFVSAEVTTEGLYSKLFPDEEEMEDNKYGGVLIASVSNYSGWHSKTLWEWLALQKNRPSNGGE